jgi:chromosome partitioning protein
MEPSIVTQVLQSPDDLKDQLTDLAATVDYLVVDGPAGLSESTRAILMRADARRGAHTTEWHRHTISRRCRETYQTSSIGETWPTPSVDIPGPCGEGNETQNQSNGIVRETCTHHQAVLKSVIHQKQVIGDSSANSYGVGSEAVNQPHILGKSTADSLKKSREP